MRFAILIVLTMSATAHAQFGIGLTPGSMCNGSFGPSPQAFNGRDEIMNLNGQLDARNRRIDQLKAKEERLSDRLSRAKSDMAEVITAKGFAAIREHRERRNGRGSYRAACGGAGPATNEATDPELFSGGRPVDDSQALYPPPAGFCVTNPRTGHPENLWDRFVEEDGEVNDRLCDFRIAGITRPANRSQRDRCHEGMREYYDIMAEKLRIREEIARLDAEARGYERRLERIQDEITEGTYCPWCAAQRRGYATQGAGNSVMQGVGVLAMLGLSLMQQQQRPPMPPRPMPPPPPVMRPPMMGPPMMMGPGYPMRPYVATVPGYYGIQPGPRPGMGTYGGMPGGFGPSGWGCQGAVPGGFGAPMMNSIYGGPSPFGNPYGNPMMNPMFNQGAGPWGFPMYANGMPGFQNPYGMDPFANPYNQNLFGPNPFAQNPFANPFMGPNPYGANPYGVNPYGTNPYAMGPYGYNPYGMGPYGPMNPYGMSPYGLGPSAMGPYGYNPYGAAPFGPNPYGLGPYGPGMNPYGSPYYAGMMPPGGIPNYGYQNPWGAPLGSPMGNFIGEIGLLNSRLQYIQNGGYYGGGGYAPPTMPYLGTPIYNSPGTMLNPAPRGNPPAVLPYTR